LEHELEFTGWRKRIISFDNLIPLILIGVLIGLISYTAGEYFHIHFHHFFHHHTVHFVSNHLLMWVFFAFLGNEITVKEISNSGKFVGLSTLGGMVVPPLFAYILTGNVYIAIGAAATDVAFSVGASKLFTRGQSHVLTLLVTALLILAVGDDLGGIGIMAGMYAEDVNQMWLLIEVGVLAFTYFCGERGVIDFKVQEAGQPDTVKHYQWVVEIQSVFFWWFLAAINTLVLYLAGVEWILGGCLAFVMAPPKVQHKIEYVLKPLIPLVLLVFGTVNGAIDLLNIESWGAITAGCFFGGMFGKQIGIVGGGLIGRSWCRRSDKKEKYANIPTGQIYGLGVLGSCNGTVAIFFVAMALSKGYISEADAAQATLGYFLTVPAVYLQSLAIKVLGIVKDVPEFQSDNVQSDDKHLVTDVV
jgi:Na+/H+ antiporter NhaA